MLNNAGSSTALASLRPTCTVDSLHDDVLLSVFLSFHQICLTCRDGGGYDCVFTTQTSPWVLSHVCRRWRILVLSTRRLWTYIHLNLDNYIYNPSIPPLRLAIVLQRSGNLELDVRIHDPQEFSEPDDTRSGLEELWTCVHSLIRLLRPTTTRWRHLEITSSRDIFEGFAGCSFERLRSLDLFYCLDVEEDQATITLFRNATKLVELTLQCQDEIDIDLPWAGIHTFFTACSGLRFLPGMLGLQNLHIEDMCGNSETSTRWEGIQSFELPLLRTITVRAGDENPVIYGLSSRLRVPSLTTLILHMWTHAQTNPSAPRPRKFPAFNNLGSESLINLSLNFLPFEFEVINIPFPTSVANLYLGSNAATPAVMEAIGLGAVPRLQTLGMHFSAWRENPDAVISMLRRREGPIPVLRFARFGPDDELVGEEVDGWDGWLSEEVQEGNAARWEVVRGSTDVQVVERYRF